MVGSAQTGAFGRMVERIGTGDDNFLYPCPDSVESIFKLRQHTARHDTLLDKNREFSLGDTGNHRIIIVGITQHSSFLEAIDERDLEIASQSLCDLGSDGVGIGVQQVALCVMSDRTHHRHHALGNQVGQQIGIHLVDIAYEAVIDRLSAAIIAWEDVDDCL